MRLFALVDEAPLPDGALLQEFVNRGEYTDCFVVHSPSNVTFTDYVGSFYTTRLFKLERLILKWLLSIPSSDQQAKQVAHGELDAFAAWNEHSRTDNQLVMMDFREQTCSWFMLVPLGEGASLFFGSAVMRNQESPTGKRMKWTYRCLLGFHRLYSRALLHNAAKALTKTHNI